MRFFDFLLSSAISCPVVFSVCLGEKTALAGRTYIFGRQHNKRKGGGNDPYCNPMARLDPGSLSPSTPVPESTRLALLQALHGAGPSRVIRQSGSLLVREALSPTLISRASQMLAPTPAPGRWVETERVSPIHFLWVTAGARVVYMYNV